MMIHHGLVGQIPGDDCDDVVITDPPVVGYPIGNPPGDIWYDSRGNRHVISWRSAEWISFL